jgi:hypothetical protein
MLPIFACPHCSSVRAKVFARPTIHHSRVNTYYLLAAVGCPHLPAFSGWNSGVTHDDVIAPWNAKVGAAAADLSARLGHTPEEAAAFLAAMDEPTYLPTR